MDIRVNYYGHNSLLITLGNLYIMVDPFITGNPLIKDQITLDRLQPNYILLTHAHQDHTLDAEAMSRQTGEACVIVSNYEIAMHYQAKGLKVHPMNHGGNWDFGEFKLQYVNAVHTSSFPDGSNGGQPGGFILTMGGKKIYIAGDTALTTDMKLIPLRHKLDLAILPIGDNFTMGYQDAVIASDFVECDKVLGVHYDTFGYIEIDHSKAKAAFAAKGKELTLLEIGGFMMV